jgi:hypothetical protein
MIDQDRAQQLKCVSLNYLHKPTKNCKHDTFFRKWCLYQKGCRDTALPHFTDRFSLGELLDQKYVGVVVCDAREQAVVAHCIGKVGDKSEFFEWSRNIDCCMEEDEQVFIDNLMTEECYKVIGMMLFPHRSFEFVRSVVEWLHHPALKQSRMM